MAVFTPLSEEDINNFLKNYDIGDLVEYSGILSGIENSNFYVTTTKGRYVLTVFERLNETQIPYYLKLQKHLLDKGLSVSGPITDKNGHLFSSLKNKPASIAPCIKGEYVAQPNAQACNQMGKMLAEMHLAVKDFPLSQENTKGLAFWESSLPSLKPYVPEELFEYLKKEIGRQKELMNSQAYKELEAGAVHADLFRNNSLIEINGDEQNLGGVIDFYFACNAPFLYDLAVTLNDWTINQETGEFLPKETKAFLEGYNSVRKLTEKEHTLWQDMLSAGALRFWVSRLYDFYLPREASMLKPHDPRHFERILKLRREADPKDLPWI